VPVTPSYRQYVLDQLGPAVPDISARGMFGGVGLYARDLFFALIDDDVLYFKVDSENRPAFEARGMGPFMPFGPGKEVMQYYEVPGDVLEDAELLGAWAEAAIEVARRARFRKAAARKRSSRKK
jgi:DNA transformation protein